MVWHSAVHGWLGFEAPVRVCVADRVDQVYDALREVEAAVGAGWHAAGYIAYEAAPAFDRALCTRPPGPTPLLWFGLYAAPVRLNALPRARGACRVGPWAPSVSRETYRQALGRIRECLRTGQTYQVNYTQRLHARFEGSDWDFFRRLVLSQKAEHCAFLRLPGLSVCSVSPELFFTLDGRTIVARPMKGTAARGLTCADDRRRAQALQRSEKDRAENIMIVDMVRNDLGRIAEPGSVQAVRLFDIERYPTLWQMTSTVQARTRAPVSAILGALFPCASITGAPKVRAMQIIRELETAPRGLYTGTIGVMFPGGSGAAAGVGRAEFNVAIRTVTIDRLAGRAEYGAGGGIVWDSDPEGEYEECQVKARVLSAPAPEFDLLETLLWTSACGYRLRERHVRRMEESAAYFGFRFDRDALQARLDERAAGFDEQAWRVRVLLAESGRIALQAAPQSADAAAPAPAVRLAWSAQPVSSDSPFLYHKTTNRAVYEQARACARVPCDDVLLYNERGEATESTVANLVCERGGRFFTPPVSCGLLPGTLRAQCLERGEIEEAPLPSETLAGADALYLINSVRGWMRARLVD